MNKNKREIQYVELPYNFISLPEEYCYPYIKERNSSENKVLPKHSNRKGISGYIEYKLIPKTDLAVEVREIEKENKFFLSGSVLRGRVRTNLEILSKSYPQFINYTPMLFRDIAGDLRDSYRKELGVEEGIEKSIQAGFLKKDNNKFFVVPSKKFPNDKFFISIKEHELTDRFLVDLEEENRLFKSKDIKWSNKISDLFAEITMIQNEVDKKTEKIKEFREEYKEQISCFDNSISDIFIKEFTFTEKLKPLRIKIKKDANNEKNVNLNDFSHNYWCELEKIKNKLYGELKKLPTEDNNLNEFFELMSERWMLKAEIDLLYYYLTVTSKNSRYKPYQKSAFYEKNNNGGIKSIKFSSSRKEERLLKGYLYNSTNAGSKRSHYLVNGSKEDKEVFFEIPEDVVESYKQNYKKIHFTKGERYSNKEMASFYNIFDNENYEKLVQEDSEGLIVFFQLEEDSEDNAVKRVKRIGRTPYFKIPYRNSIKDIIGERKKNKIDYAEALFGYATEKADTSGRNREEEKDIYLSYKSRLRFSAIDIEWDKSKLGGQLNSKKVLKSNQFLLPSPSATAYGMYLEQVDGAELITYQDEMPRLRGYKYYHIWNEVEKSKQGTENIMSMRGIINKESVSQLKGRIYFYNLKPQELGLLLISLDIKELLQSKKYCNDFEEFFKHIKSSRELIGGAKPYGYGSIKVEIDGVHIEKEDNSFESLILEPLRKEEDRYEYIDKYLEEAYKAGGKCVLLCRLKEYVISKQERVRDKRVKEEFTKQHPTQVSWYTLSEKSKDKKGGYPKEWRLVDKLYKHGNNLE